MRFGPLEIGIDAPLMIRQERISTDPLCRLLYMSDVHLRRGRSERLIRAVIDATERSSPDVVLLGGDLVDQASQLQHLRELVSRLVEFAPVLAVSGNHDCWIGAHLVRDAVERGGGLWIEESFAEIRHGERRVSISGPACDAYSPADVRVLCAHNPRVWKSVHRQGYDLVLAGHLHGCQFVAFEYRDRLYPGACFYRYNCLAAQRGGSRLVVSRGVSDLAPIRWSCPREVILCHL